MKELVRIFGLFSGVGLWLKRFMYRHGLRYAHHSSVLLVVFSVAFSVAACTLIFSAVQVLFIGDMFTFDYWIGVLAGGVVSFLSLVILIKALGSLFARMVNKGVMRREFIAGVVVFVVVFVVFLVMPNLLHLIDESHHWFVAVGSYVLLALSCGFAVYCYINEKAGVKIMTLDQYAVKVDRKTQRGEADVLDDWDFDDS